MANFQKRHYEALAGFIKSIPFNEFFRQVIAGQLAGALLKDNPDFNSRRFYTACGLLPAEENPNL